MKPSITARSIEAEHEQSIREFAARGMGRGESTIQAAVAMMQRKGIGTRVNRSFNAKITNHFHLDVSGR